jgi:hypothetical protein
MSDDGVYQILSRSPLQQIDYPIESVPTMHFEDISARKSNGIT